MAHLGGLGRARTTWPSGWRATGTTFTLVNPLPSAVQTRNAPATRRPMRTTREGCSMSSDEAAILVGHSYSGMVIAELADHPNVRHSVYLCALWPERGSGTNLMGDVLPPSLVLARDDGAMQIVDDFDLAWQACSPHGPRARLAERMMSRSVLQSYSSVPLRAQHPIGHIPGDVHHRHRVDRRVRGRTRGCERPEPSTSCEYRPGHMAQLCIMRGGRLTAICPSARVRAGTQDGQLQCRAAPHTTATITSQQSRPRAAPARPRSAPRRRGR